MQTLWTLAWEYYCKIYIFSAFDQDLVLTKFKLVKDPIFFLFDFILREWVANEILYCRKHTQKGNIVFIGRGSIW